MQLFDVLRREADHRFQEVVDGPVVGLDRLVGLLDPSAFDTVFGGDVLCDPSAPRQVQDPLVGLFPFRAKVVIGQQEVLNDGLFVDAQHRQEKHGRVPGPVLSADAVPEDGSAVGVQEFPEKAAEHLDPVFRQVHLLIPFHEIGTEKVSPVVLPDELFEKVGPDVEALRREQKVLHGRIRVIAVCDAVQFRVLPVGQDVPRRAEIDVLDEVILFDEFLFVGRSHVGQFSGPEQFSELDGAAVFRLVAAQIPGVGNAGQAEAVFLVCQRLRAGGRGRKCRCHGQEGRHQHQSEKDMSLIIGKDRDTKQDRSTR